VRGTRRLSGCTSDWARRVGHDRLVPSTRSRRPTSRRGPQGRHRSGSRGHRRTRRSRRGRRIGVRQRVERLPKLPCWRRGVANCGSAGSESCCTSLALTAGTFDRSYRYVADAAIDAADPATISGVKLDKYEVTVGRFRQYENQMNDGGLGTPSAGEGKHTYLNGGAGLVNVGDGGAGGGTPSYEPGWVTADKAYFMPTPMHLQCDVVDGSANVGTWTPSVGGNESLPINCVNWFEAYAFCIWDGGFLPTEAEWEYAAAGGSQLREYPWGSTAPGTTNHYAIYDCLFGATSDAACTRDNVSFSSIAPVGTAAAGDGPWGQVDLAGNLFEWTLDTFQPTYIDPCTDCANLSASATPASQSRVIRGGAFNQGSGSLLSARRQASGAQNRSPAIGFRCARAP